MEKGEERSPAKCLEGKVWVPREVGSGQTPQSLCLQIPPSPPPVCCLHSRGTGGFPSGKGSLYPAICVCCYLPFP